MRKWTETEFKRFNAINRKLFAKFNQTEKNNKDFIELDIASDKAIRDLIKHTAKYAPKNISLDDAMKSSMLYRPDHYAIWYEAFKDKLTDYARFWVLVYLNSGAPYYSIPKEEIIALKEIRPADYLKDLDAGLKNVDPITVYRGGNSCQQEQRLEISWTTDPVIAIRFYNRRTDGAKIWKATISKNKIIATYNGRDEYEIMQYCDVEAVQELQLSETQINSALAEYDNRWEQ